LGQDAQEGEGFVLKFLRFALAVFAAALLFTAGGASADWRDTFSVLRVGVVTGANAAYRKAQLEPFRLYLEARTALPVEIVPLPSYDALIEAQSSMRIHYGIYSATAFSTAAFACHCVEPLAVPTAAGGETGFHAILVARSDGPIRSLADAKDKRLALAGPDSVAGRLLPMKAFEAEGIVPAEHFSEILDKTDPEMALTALLDGEADLAAAWSSLAGDETAGYSFGSLAALVTDGRLSMDRIRIVWQSPLIPFGPHAVRTDMPEELKTLLADALTAMAGEDPAALDAVDRTGGGGFVSADASLFAPTDALIAR
jgi:phosphonate transport system substrate-binding protein